MLISRSAKLQRVCQQPKADIIKTICHPTLPIWTKRCDRTPNTQGTVTLLYTYVE